MHKTKLIVFDIDGTLTDTVGVYTSIYIESLKDMGIQQMNIDFKSYKHHTDSYIGKEIYEKNTNRPFSSEQLDRFENYLTQRCFKETIVPIKGATEIIDYLETKTEYAICYATGSLLKPAEYKLDSIGISYPSKLLVASNQIHEREGIVQEAINNAKTHYQVEHFERIISIGDGLWDLKTAKNLNIQFIGIGTTSKEILSAAGSTDHFDDFSNFRIP